MEKPEIKRDWESYTSSPVETTGIIKELLSIPESKDMPSVIARGVYKNERQRLAVVKLHKRHVKFGDTKNEEALRAWVASTIGLGGLGRFEASMAAVRLWAPDSYRVVRGLGKTKNEERVIRGSDYVENEDKQKIEGK